MSPSQLDTEFHALHDAGAERHPTQWYRCNEIAAEAMSALGIRLDDKQARALSTLVILRMLDRFRPLGTSEDPSEENFKRVVNIISARMPK